jgi:uncharacterized membrane protein SirB2
MDNLTVTLAIVLSTMLASLFVYFAVMFLDKDRTTKSIRTVCYILAVVFLVIGGLIAFI